MDKTEENSKPAFTAKQVFAKIRKGIPIENVSVVDTIQLNLIASRRRVNSPYGKLFETAIDKPITFVGCNLQKLLAGNCAYNRLITFDRCIFEHAAFDSCYVKAGIIFKSCQFMNDVLFFQYSGHNQIDRAITIADCVFNGFIDMADATFEGPVIIMRNRFDKGTNLLGNKDKALSVFFKVNPIIKENEGILDLDGEIFDWKKFPTVWMTPERPRRKRFLLF